MVQLLRSGNESAVDLPVVVSKEERNIKHSTVWPLRLGKEGIVDLLGESNMEQPGPMQEVEPTEERVPAEEADMRDVRGWVYETSCFV